MIISKSRRWNKWCSGCLESHDRQWQQCSRQRRGPCWVQWALLLRSSLRNEETCPLHWRRMEGIEILMISPNNAIPTKETLYHHSTYPGSQKWEWYCASKKLPGPQLLSWAMVRYTCVTRRVLSVAMSRVSGILEIRAVQSLQRREIRRDKAGGKGGNRGEDRKKRTDNR